MKGIFRVLNSINVALLNKKSLAVVYPDRLNLSFKVVKILYQEGFILGYFYDIHYNKLTILLNYYKGKSVIKGITSFNKSVLPLYIKYTDLITMGKIGVSLMILSTTMGLMTHYEALKNKVGGKAICLIK